MNLEQFNSLDDPTPQEQYVYVQEINGPDRTLIYGYNYSYNCNWDIFHLYLMNGQIHYVYYNDVRKKLVGYPLVFDKILARECVPSHGVYPERSDYEFCKLLLSKGIYIPFETFPAKPFEEKQFYGLTDYTGWWY